MIRSMQMRLYAGNLSYGTDANGLRDVFEAVGAVEDAVVISDRESGRSKGFGFVDMPEADARKAIAELHGKEVDGRKLVVNEAKPRAERPNRR